MLRLNSLSLLAGSNFKLDIRFFRFQNLLIFVHEGNNCQAFIWCLFCIGPFINLVIFRDWYNYETKFGCLGGLFQAAMLLIGALTTFVELITIWFTQTLSAFRF